MAAGIGAIHVKKERGVMVVVGRGQTPRGKAYIKKSIPLNAKSPADPKFKSELEQAVEEMLAE